MNKTLLVLAAGMGSRYGSLKQMDGVGPNSEAIIDYSIYDAIRAGFDKVVFVIRHSFEKNFKEVFSAARFNGKIKVEYVFQELDYLPQGYSVPEGREKPWGTNHALLMAKDVIREPFAVINADDYYGVDAYKVLGDYLDKLNGKADHYAMVGFKLKNTLSDFGSVSRGVCSVDADHNLTGMVERTHIEKSGDGAVFKDEKGDLVPISVETEVSMNMFGFTPDYFNYSEGLFTGFLDANMANLKAEYFIPYAVNALISTGKASMKVLETSSKWFGVTYKEDRPDVVARLQKLHADGTYPAKLWE